jgi:hypothetical protein
MNLYVWNITNADEFISGRDKKLKLQEIGPITFREILEHKDIVVHSENSTLSYTVTRRIEFKESANIPGILNQTVIVANMAALSGCSYVADSFIREFECDEMMKTFPNCRFFSSKFIQIFIISLQDKASCHDNNLQLLFQFNRSSSVSFQCIQLNQK